MSEPEKTNRSVTTGCALLVVSAGATGVLGLMALGSLVPDLVRTLFAAALVCLAGSIALVSIIGAVTHARDRRRP